MSDKQVTIKKTMSLLKDTIADKQKKDEELRSCKQLVIQKQKMLETPTNEKRQVEAKIGAMRNNLAACEANLDKI